MKSPNTRAESRLGTHGQANVGRLMPGPESSGPNPIEALESSWLIGCLGPKVPTMPPFSLPGREIIPGWEKRI